LFKKLFAKKPNKRVTISGTSIDFEVGKNQTVLEAALAQGFEFPHDCTVGTCGSCRSKLLSGQVDAITPFGYTLSREELAAGYILSCQAVPKSDIEIAVDLEAAAHVETVPGRIVELRDLTHDIKLVSWEVERPIAYKAGQYMNVRWPDGPGPRSYSFSTEPGKEGRTRVSTFIRKVPGGAFTEALFRGELDDAAFEIEAPHGHFWLREGSGPIILVGGGSGLSPLMSLLEDGVTRAVRRDAILLFGGREERDLYFLEEIAEIGRRWQGKFEFWPVLSQTETPGRRFGMVTAEISTAIAELGGTAGLQAYMCGPPAMIDAGVAALTSQGVAIDDIHYDKFTDASTGGN
jgi:p-cymene monooxygenase electron transfer component